MSALTITQQQLTTTNHFEGIQNNSNNKKDWSYLVPTIGALALGVIFAPNVPIGMAIGVAGTAVSLLIVLTAYAAGKYAENEDSEYSKFIRDNLLVATLAAPILEEGFFRGLLQPLTTRAILWIAPAAGLAFAGTAFSVATTVSIVATATFFGALHASNNHKNAHTQAVCATLGGIILGATAAQFGLSAAIAAHIINNTIAVSLPKPTNRAPGV